MIVKIIKHICSYQVFLLIIRQRTKEKRKKKKDKRYPDESGKESGICRGKLERLCLKKGFFLVFEKF